jgi:peroxiredoxin
MGLAALNSIRHQGRSARAGAVQLLVLGAAVAMLASPAAGPARAADAAVDPAGDAVATVEAPDFVLKSLSGPNLRLSEYRGRIVLLTFWASWCGECRGPLEDLADLALAHEDEGVELLAVGLDGDRQRIAGAAEALGARYPVLHDSDGEVGRVYDVESLPYLVLIDRDGIVRGRFEGFGRGEQPYLALFEQVLGEWPVLTAEPESTGARE